MQPNTHVCINGVRTNELLVHDRGLMYGDGLFETIAVKQAVPLLWDEHMRRLVEGCNRLDIRQPDITLLHQEAMQLCSERRHCVLKIIITRGAGNRGYRAENSQQPSRILYCSDWHEYPADWFMQGINVMVCSTRLGKNDRLAGIKHLNRLEQVLARSEWGDEYVEGLMLDTDGNVIEGTMTNVFVVRDNALYTPDLSACGVSGVMRQHILDTAKRMSIPTFVCALSIQDIMQAESVFFCNSLIGIWPVYRLLEQNFTRHALIDVISHAIEH